MTYQNSLLIGRSGLSFMSRFIVFLAVLLILSSCVDQEKTRLKSDLAACQARQVIQECMIMNLDADEKTLVEEEAFCTQQLCFRYPEAIPCQ